ncbi:MAG: hypothetical protein NTX36_03190 [Proteobacteria bacterium]|nr:hypothetical protein [Pseudomonadota bacterium]
MEFIEGDSDSSDSYPISLVGSLHQPLPLFYPTNYRDARQAAEKLARFLGKPLEDTSTGTKIVKDSEYLDETFIEYLKRMKETVQLPPTPLRMRTIIEKTGNGIVLNIPGPQYGPARWFILIFPVILAGIVAFFFIRPLVLLPGPPAIRYGMACFAFIFFVFGPIVSTIRFLGRMSRQSTNISVTKTAFAAGEMAGRKRTVSEIPFTELEDLVLILDRKTIESIDIGGKPYRPDGRPFPRFVQFFMKYAKNSSIIARSNKTMITFGKGLPQEELAYLYQLIRQTISHS